MLEFGIYGAAERPEKAEIRGAITMRNESVSQANLSLDFAI